MEISNHCRQNCLYCGLRRGNRRLRRYRMDGAAIFDAAKAVKRVGFGTVVLQSGEDSGLSAEAVAELVERIKRDLGLAVTLSLGEWDRATYALWRRSGADRYLLKLETMEEMQYARLRPGRRLSERLNALMHLRDLGYEVGSGLITGLPEETEESLDRGLEGLASLELDMLSVSPFIPHPETPLKGHPPGDVTTNLYAMALGRKLMPEAHIPVTSALGLQGDAVRLAALEVADVLMLSLTPPEVRGDYAIYPGKNGDLEDPQERAARFRPILEAAGFTVPSSAGGAWRLGAGS
ncbi:MAG: radical SAM protein [Azoarcus sp.]|nr:radical SAM protein [Azoarcus sp.]